MIADLKKKNQSKIGIQYLIIVTFTKHEHILTGS